MIRLVNLESMVLVHCTILLEHVVTVRTSCFDTDFASEIKLTKFPFNHYFINVFKLTRFNLVFSVLPEEFLTNIAI